MTIEIKVTVDLSPKTVEVLTGLAQMFSVPVIDTSPVYNPTTTVGFSTKEVVDSVDMTKVDAAKVDIDEELALADKLTADAAKAASKAKAEAAKKARAEKRAAKKAAEAAKVEAQAEAAKAEAAAEKVVADAKAEAEAKAQAEVNADFDDEAPVATYTKADVRDALRAFAVKNDKTAAIAILKNANASSLGELDEDKYADVISACKV